MSSQSQGLFFCFPVAKEHSCISAASFVVMVGMKLCESGKTVDQKQKLCVTIDIASRHLSPCVLFDSLTSTSFRFSSSQHFFFVAFKSIAFSFTDGCILAKGTVYVSLFVLGLLLFITMKPTSFLHVSLSSSQHTVLKIILFACIWEYFSLSFVSPLPLPFFCCIKFRFYMCIPSSGYFVFCDSFPVFYFLFCQQ